ncbi:hypothetical protein JCM6882_009250 [Rhodosporidiobolus microsporus]
MTLEYDQLQDAHLSGDLSALELAAEAERAAASEVSRRLNERLATLNRTNDPSPLHRLPDELLLHILSYLSPSPSSPSVDLAAAALASPILLPLARSTLYTSCHFELYRARGGLPSTGEWILRRSSGSYDLWLALVDWPHLAAEVREVSFDVDLSDLGGDGNGLVAFALAQEDQRALFEQGQETGSLQVRRGLALPTTREERKRYDARWRRAAASATQVYEPPAGDLARTVGCLLQACTSARTVRLTTQGQSRRLLDLRMRTFDRTIQADGGEPISFPSVTTLELPVLCPEDVVFFPSLARLTANIPEIVNPTDYEWVKPAPPLTELSLGLAASELTPLAETSIPYFEWLIAASASTLTNLTLTAYDDDGGAFLPPLARFSALSSLTLTIDASLSSSSSSSTVFPSFSYPPHLRSLTLLTSALTAAGPTPAPARLPPSLLSPPLLSPLHDSLLSLTLHALSTPLPLLLSSALPSLRALTALTIHRSPSPAGLALEAALGMGRGGWTAERCKELRRECEARGVRLVGEVSPVEEERRRVRMGGGVGGVY